MKRALLIVCLFSFLIPILPSEADAFWWRWRRRARTRVSVSVQVQSGTPYQVCLQKAQIQARRGGRCFHPGGSFAGCRYEGVGSGSTAAQALANCCYSGARGSRGPRRHCVAEAVVQSSNGRYYACRLYR